MYDAPLFKESDLIRDIAPLIPPISRLAALGPAALSDIELLTIVLHTRSLAPAQKLLEKESGSELLRKPFQELARLSTLGENRAAVLLAATEFVRRADKTVADPNPAVRTLQDVVLQVHDIRDKAKEHLVALYLNARHRLIAKEIVSIGTLTASLAHPREIFGPAIGKAAAGVVLAHNHPSGDPSPSDEDVRLTRRISQAGQILGIELLDHVIVSAQESYSFKAGGRL